MIEPAIDLVSVCYLLVIIIGIYHIKEEKGESTKAYIYCCWVCFAGLIIDVMSFIIPGWVQNGYILGAANYLSLVWHDILLAAYCFYLVSLIKEKTGIFRRRMLWILWGLCALDFVFLTLWTLTGHMFAVENEQFILDPWSHNVSAIPTVILLVYIYYLFSNSKVLRFRDLLSLSTYFILQELVAVLWFFEITVISGYAGFALSLTVIFVMI